MALPFSPSRDDRRGARVIALLYAIIAGLWILFSDRLLEQLVADPRMFTRAATFKGWFFVLITALLLYWLIARYVDALRARDRELQEVVQSIATVTGEEFFSSLVRNLAVGLKADYALVGEITGDDRSTVRTIAVFGDGRSQDNFEYQLAGTPCANVTSEGRICFYPKGVIRLFPDDSMLVSLGMESYLGAPLRSYDSRVMGVMAVISSRPMPETSMAPPFFQLFAVRAAAELERRNAEEAIREAAMNYRIVADNTHDWEFWLRPDGGFIYSSPSCLQVTGYSSDEFSADSDLLNRIIHPDDRLLFAGHRQESAETSRGDLEFRIVRPDGTVTWIHHVCQPVFSDSGAFLGTRGSNRDVTERKRSEAALKAQFDQMNTIFDSINALVYVADMNTYDLLYMNKYGTQLTSSDWRGRKCYEILYGSQNVPCDFCTRDELVQDGEPTSDCTWEFQNSITGRWYQCIDRAIRWTDGRLVRLEIAIDISERKEMEQMKDEIISAVSHEMRTPLTAMMGFTEFLLETDVNPDEGKAYLKTIHKETLRLSELISNFLDLQQIKAKLVSYQFVPLQVCPLLKEVALRFRSDGTRHEIIVECPEGLPQVQGDEARLQQILSNLVSNSIKYSPSGTPITLGAFPENGMVTLWVRDEGVGIPPELKEKIFETFYRLDNTDRRMIGGTGVGLTLVKELVAAHGGMIRLESNLGKGSTFYVSIPAATDASGP